MATFAEIMGRAGGGMAQAFEDPWTQFGLQMLAAGGEMPGNPSFGQRFAQAGQGFMQQQRQSQELQQQKLLRQVQMGQLMRQMQQGESQEEARKRVQEAVRQDPNLLANNPLARAVLESTGDYTQMKDLAEFGPKAPGAPRTPWTYTENLPTGDQVQYIYNPATGQHEPSQPFRPTQQQNVDQRVAQFSEGRQRWETEQQFRERQAAEKANQFQQTYQQREQQFGQTLGQREQQQDFREREAQRKQGNWETEQQRAARQADIAAQKAETAAQTEQRRQRAEFLKTNVERGALQRQYRGAVNQIETARDLAQRVINHEGLAGNFGIRGSVPNVPGSDAADAAAMINRLRSVGGLQEIIKLKNSGVSFGQLSNFEQEQAQKAFVNLENAQSVEQARESLSILITSLDKLKDGMSQDYANTDRLYDLNTQQPAQGGQQAPAVGTIEDGYEYMGGDPGNPNSWRKR